MGILLLSAQRVISRLIQCTETYVNIGLSSGEAGIRTVTMFQSKTCEVGAVFMPDSPFMTVTYHYKVGRLFSPHITRLTHIPK